MDHGKSGRVEGKIKQLKLIWLSIIASVCVIAAAALVLLSQSAEKAPLTGEEAERAVMALAVMAILLISFGKLAGDRFLARYRAKGRADGLRPEETGREFWFKPEEERVEAIFPVYFQANVIRWASSEGVGILGFVCVMLAGEAYLIHGAAFWAVSIALLLYQAPTGKELYALAGRGEGL